MSVTAVGWIGSIAEAWRKVRPIHRESDSAFDCTLAQQDRIRCTAPPGRAMEVTQFANLTFSLVADLGG